MPRSTELEIFFSSISRVPVVNFKLETADDTGNRGEEKGRLSQRMNR